MSTPERAALALCAMAVPLVWWPRWWEPDPLRCLSLAVMSHR